MEKGTLKKSDPIHFVMNLFSLMAYPIIMAPLYRKLFDLNKQTYADLLKERKALVFRILCD